MMSKTEKGQISEYIRNAYKSMWKRQQSQEKNIEK